MKKLIPQLLGFTLPKPTKTVYTVLRQLVQWIPPGMIQRLADGHKLDIRKWSAVSHVVALMYGQLAGCDSLNGIVDAARVLRQHPYRADPPLLLQQGEQARMHQQFVVQRGLVPGAVIRGSQRRGRRRRRCWRRAGRPCPRTRGPRSRCVSRAP